jgi:phosphoglycerol transferase MdoB-like AlkP superfamily enzyme
VVSYTDHALQQFFAVCRNMPWFHNTLFVFTADHWLDPADGRTPLTESKAFSIPIFIYDPSRDTGRRYTTIASQVDIAPTVLDLLGYKGAYTGFGRSLLDTTIAAGDRYVVNKWVADYQIITDQYIYGYDPDRDKGDYLYRYTSDSACRHDLLEDGSAGPVRERLERLLKANIQCYREALTARNLFSF